MKKLIVSIIVVGLLLTTVPLVMANEESVGEIEYNHDELVQDVLEEYRQLSQYNENKVYKECSSTITREPNVIYYMPGEVIVGFKKEGGNIDVANLNTFEGHSIINKIEELNVALVEVDKDSEIDFIKTAESNDEVFFAERNTFRYLLYEPNDPHWDSQWGPKAISCPAAWDIEKGCDGVKVSVIDSGIDYEHEDLKDNYEPRGSFDFGGMDNDPMDIKEYGHGTHCSGILGATINNNKGIAGIAQVGIRAVKIFFFLDPYYGYVTTIFHSALGIRYAAFTGSKVISMSYGGGGYSIVEMYACSYAYHVRGVLLVAGAGNEGGEYILSPACYSTVIAVGAINQNKKRCSFSSYGNCLELVAPGTGILSTMPNNKYESHSGTSMACPHVAGVAALLRSKYPLRTNGWIKRMLQQTAEDLGDPGWDKYYGYGLVNASAALKKQTNEVNIKMSQSIQQQNVLELTQNELNQIYDYLDTIKVEELSKYEIAFQSFEKSIFETENGAVQLDLELLESNAQQISKEMGVSEELEKIESGKSVYVFFATFDITGVGQVMTPWEGYSPGEWFVMSQFILKDTSGYVKGLIGGPHEFSGETLRAGAIWFCRVSIWDNQVEPKPSRIKGFCFSISFIID